MCAIAIGCITVMQMFAMAHGHNGVIMMSCIAADAGIAGGFCGFQIAKRGK